MISESSEKIDQESIKKIGIKELAMKPLSVKDLSEMIRRVLDERKWLHKSAALN